MAGPDSARCTGRSSTPLSNRTRPAGAKRLVTFDPNTGEVLSYELVERAGVLTFDSAAERALALITKIPLPPPQYGSNVVYSPI